MQWEEKTYQRETSPNTAVVVMYSHVIDDFGGVFQTHSITRCFNQTPAWCSIHNPIPGPWSDWPAYWHQDTLRIMRVCPCGVGHPDPSQFAWWYTKGALELSAHACCARKCCHGEGR